MNLRPAGFTEERAISAALAYDAAALVYFGDFARPNLTRP
jgi:hypothetical protein